MLASGAVLDYGSIRQFAAKHDKYRFKDVDRYSASLAEQRGWARLIVQTFAQAMAFICSGEKQNLRAFKDSGCLKAFDTAFENESNYRMLGGKLPDGSIIEDGAARQHVVAVPRQPVEDVFLLEHRGHLSVRARQVVEGLIVFCVLSAVSARNRSQLAAR